MSVNEINLLLYLILAHLVGDFFLQRANWIVERYDKKFKSPRLYLHVTIHAVLALVVMLLAKQGIGVSVLVALVIGVTHLVIDIGKSYTPNDSAVWFVIDQILHLVVLIAVWVIFTGNGSNLVLLLENQITPDLLLVIIAYIMAIRPLQFMIAIAVSKWASKIDNTGSLAQAGAVIGKVERFLVLTFILVDQFAAIGFLIAAKSVLRFGDLKDPNHRRLTEYVLVGTLLSFSGTVVIGLVTKYLMSLT